MNRTGNDFGAPWAIVATSERKDKKRMKIKEKRKNKGGLEELSLEKFEIGVKQGKIKMVRLTMSANPDPQYSSLAENADCYVRGEEVAVDSFGRLTIKAPTIYGKYIDGGKK